MEITKIIIDIKTLFFLLVDDEAVNSNTAIILLGNKMDDASALQLEDLPVEILVAICRYLSDRELYIHHFHV
jgi:uncharacterized ferredoxin-like protein